MEWLVQIAFAELLEPLRSNKTKEHFSNSLNYPALQHYLLALCTETLANAIQAVGGIIYIKSGENATLGRAIQTVVKQMEDSEANVRHGAVRNVEWDTLN